MTLSSSALPSISFIIVVGKQERAETSLRSCLAQTLASIEVICVCPVDGPELTASWYQDPRVVVISPPAGTPTAASRQAGVAAARATHVMFVDSGESIAPDMSMRLHDRLQATHAQLVGVVSDGVPPHAVSNVNTAGDGCVTGSDIVRRLVPRDAVAKLAPWRMLFQVDLLRDAYAAVSECNDLPLLDDRAVILHAYVSANSFASISAFPGYGKRRTPLAWDGDYAGFHDILGQLDAFMRAEGSIRERARFSTDPEPLIDSYMAGYLTIVAEAISAFAALPQDQREAQHNQLLRNVDEMDALAAAVAFAPELLPTLIRLRGAIELGGSPVGSVLLTTNVLTTGGVSGVLLAQARFLLRAGYRVTIATHRPGSAESIVPDGATLVQLNGVSRQQRVKQWARICDDNNVDIVIDHRILYSRDWPAYALAARSSGAATIGWIHNFAGRPTYNGNDLQTLMQTHLAALSHLVVLSPLDVAFWKLRGISHVSYLPNPPSPFLLDVGPAPSAKDAPRERPLELIWWGRLEEHTKKVSQLVKVASSLRRLGVDFRLRIVGPDWADMTAARLRELAAKHGVADRVEPTGPKHGAELLELIDSADVFINTSIIEGYPLTLPEAQSRGLPVVMYDLPWLSLVEGNAGVITTPQQDPDSLAAALADLAADPERYRNMSRASLANAARASSYDFAQLYEDLLRGRLSPQQSPVPSVEDGRKILELLIFFAERSTPPPRATKSDGARPGRRRRGGRRPRSLGQRIERKLTPLGHVVVDTAPWLRPVAARFKRVLLRR